jgi:hypothetical protein
MEILIGLVGGWDGYGIAGMVMARYASRVGSFVLTSVQVAHPIVFRFAVRMIVGRPYSPDRTSRSARFERIASTRLWRGAASRRIYGGV